MDSRYEKGERLYSNAKTSVCVYNALDTHTGEEVVIKEVATSRPEVANRFLRESWIQACLSHPNICKFYGSYYYKDDDEYLCGIVMEKLPCDLWRLIESASRSNSHLPESTVWIFLRQLISALSMAQEKDICHRDIKPQNLLVDASRSIIKLGDMGASKVFTPGDTMATIQGTLTYLSPILKEQYRCNVQTGTAAKARHNPYKSDVYSLGITVICMGRGQVPEELGQRENLAEKLERAIREIAHFGSEMKALVKLMVSVEEEGRPDFIQLKRFFYEDIEPWLDCLTHEGCLACFRTEEGDKLQLPCHRLHYFCRPECLVDYVNRETKSESDPPSSVQCRYCRTAIPPSLLRPHFSSLNPSPSREDILCFTCQGKLQSLLISRCPHHFCLHCLNTLKYPKRCPICDVPFDRDQLKKQKCRVF